MDNLKTSLHFLIFLLGVNMACGSVSMAELERDSNVISKQLSADLAIVRKGRILFSHHSVGANIINGVKQLDTEVPGENLIHWGTVEEAEMTKGPMLIHFSGGQNGEPKTKIDAFAATIRGNTHLKPALAFMKFCFVDFDPHTDVDSLFNYYRNTMEKLKHEHPEIKFAYITAPLKVRPTELKWRVFRLIGKEVWEDSANVKRAEFNRRLVDTFGASNVFDLAHFEAMSPEGNMTIFEQGGQQYLSLFPGYTEDGGHLNTLGQQVLGKAFIRFVAEQLRAIHIAR